MVLLLSKLFKRWDFRHEPPHAAVLENVLIGWRYQMGASIFQSPYWIHNIWRASNLGTFHTSL